MTQQKIISSDSIARTPKRRRDPSKVVHTLPNSCMVMLEGLARYKFLTYEQMKLLGAGKNLDNIRDRMKLIRASLPDAIGSVDFGVMPKIGKLPSLYYLTASGAELVAELLDLEIHQVKHPLGRNLIATRDYFHRVATVDFLICFELWAKAKGYTVLKTDAYFDKTGANRTGPMKLTAKNKIDIGHGDFIIPDAVCLYSDGELTRLCLAEIYNGHDTKRVVEQLRKHVLALSEGSPSIKYGLNRANTVACVFETEEAMQSVMERVRQEEYFAASRKNLLFGTMTGLKAHFSNAWSSQNMQKSAFI